MNNTSLISEVSNCAAVCNYCADACLGEDNVKMMVECIRLDRDCAAICTVTASMLAGNSKNVSKIISICADICDQCAAECEKHAEMHDHCRECAEACRKCAEACRSYS